MLLIHGTIFLNSKRNGGFLHLIIPILSSSIPTFQLLSERLLLLITTIPKFPNGQYPVVDLHASMQYLFQTLIILLDHNRRSMAKTYKSSWIGQQKSLTASKTRVLFLVFIWVTTACKTPPLCWTFFPCWPKMNQLIFPLFLGWKKLSLGHSRVVGNLCVFYGYFHRFCLDEPAYIISTLVTPFR